MDVCSVSSGSKSERCLVTNTKDFSCICRTRWKELIRLYHDCSETLWDSKATNNTPVKSLYTSGETSIIPDRFASKHFMILLCVNCRVFYCEIVVVIATWEERLLFYFYFLFFCIPTSLRQCMLWALQRRNACCCSGNLECWSCWMVSGTSPNLRICWAVIRLLKTIRQAF